MTNMTRGRNSVQKTINLELGCQVKKGVICFYLDIWETDKSECPAENWIGNWLGLWQKKVGVINWIDNVISHYKEFLKLQRRARNCLQGLIYIYLSTQVKNKNKLASKTIILLCFSFIYHYRVSLLSSVCWSLGNNLYLGSLPE